MIPAAFRSVRAVGARRAMSSTVGFDLYNPTEDHQALRDMVRRFTEDNIEPQALEFDRDEKFNHALWKELGDIGLLGMSVDEKHGGSGMDAVATCIAHEEMSASDPGFTLAYLAHSLLFTHNLAHNGTEEQCDRFLPDACSGARIGGMCMSEPGAGTDVLGLRTTAKKTDSGSYVINGSKMWITNGPMAPFGPQDTGDMFLVYARTGEYKDLSLFIVEKGMEGFKLGQRINGKCGMRASNTAELVFEDVEVPATNLVGKEHGGVIPMMRNLEIERVALAAMSLGIARRSIEVMNKYCNERTSFGKPINNYGQIQKHIADSYAEFMAGRAYTYDVARRMDFNQPGQRIDTDGVKLYCSVMATNIANRAMQCLGGNGYVAEYNVERLWRDAKLLEIGGGTLEAHQKNMTRDLSKIETLF